MQNKKKIKLKNKIKIKLPYIYIASLITSVACWIISLLVSYTYYSKEILFLKIDHTFTINIIGFLQILAFNLFILFYLFKIFRYNLQKIPVILSALYINIFIFQVSISDFIISICSRFNIFFKNANTVYWIYVIVNIIIYSFIVTYINIKISLKDLTS